MVEFGGAMSGEHGDGLARSLWNRKLFGPEVYAAFEAVKRAFDPENRLNPGKVVGDADPGDNLRIGPDYHPHEPHPTVLDFSDQGGFRPRGRDVLGRRCLPQDRRRHDVPQLHGHPRRNAHDPRPRQPAPPGDDRRTARRRTTVSTTRPSTKHSTSACNARRARAECPSQGRHGQAQGRGAPSAVPEPAAPLEPSASGPDLPPEPDRGRHGPAGQPGTAQPGVQMAAREGRRHRPAANAAHVRRTSISANGFAAIRSTPAPARAGRVVLLDDCFTTYNDPEVGIAAVRVLEAAGYRVELAGLACCGRPAISKGLLPLARELADANVKKLARFARRGIPIVGCEPSCLVTLVDEYRDFRLGPDAEDGRERLR